MQDLVFSAQRSLSEAEEENRDLRHKLDDREELKQLSADLEMDIVGHYYIRKSERARGIIPYCPTCWGTGS